MFTFALYDYLVANYTSFGGSSIVWGYGEVDTTSPTPFISFNVVDDDTSEQVLCDDIQDSGDVLIDMNIYTPNREYGESLRADLEKFVYNITTLTGYRLNLNLHGTGSVSKEGKLWILTLSRQITYNKEA